ncbi:ABC transporter permease [Tamilnaduibacter salinus]|uniref:ABC transporter permease n=1 Tax=Tamilnaduibacter salinus TaxID=1484056 RepID=UPI001303FC95|nr:ABC transporter permease [Tamilnaduibacter salinus]
MLAASEAITRIRIWEVLPVNRAVNWFDIVWLRAAAELHRDVTRTYLGILWWVIEPLLYMTAFYLIFAMGIRGGEDGEGFVGFLLAGLVIWKWFSTTVIQGAGALLSNRGLIQQVYLPKVLLPLIPVMANTLKFGLVLVLLLGYVWVFQRPPGWDWLALFPVLAAALLLVAGCTLFSAALVPFAEDLRMLINNGMLLMMFLSGVFFDVADFPEAVRDWFYLNPLVGLLEGVRQVLLASGLPDWEGVAYAAGFGGVLCALAVTFLVRFDRVYPKRVA